MKIAIRLPEPIQDDPDQGVVDRNIMRSDKAEVWLRCPACDSYHMIPVDISEAMLLDPDKPTTGNFRIRKPTGGQCCFSIDDGTIKYTRYSTHAMADRQTELPDLQPEDFDG